MMKKVLLASAAIVVFLLFILVMNRYTAPSYSLPATLGSLQLVEQMAGQEARTVINLLHDKGVTPDENFIGEYAAESGKATLYVSVYGGRDETVEAEQKMARRIEQGSPVFTRYRTLTIDGRNVSECVGMGQIHYFFSQGQALFWLAVDMQVAQQTLQTLLASTTGD
jgi:hypothetical protein